MLSPAAPYERQSIPDRPLARGIGGAVDHAWHARGIRDDERRRAAAVEIDRVARAERTHQHGELAQRHPVTVGRLASVHDDENETLAVAGETDRGAGMPARREGAAGVDVREDGALAQQHWSAADRFLRA